MIYHDSAIWKSTNYSLCKNSAPISRNSSIDKSQSGTFTRKMSTSSLKDYVNIDKLIGEIKLRPNKDHQNDIEEHLKIIFKSLNVLKEFPSIYDQVKTIQLLLESIEKKIISKTLSDTRSRNNQSLKRGLQSSTKKYQNISPIKQFQDTSRIVYTNFSLKELNQVKNQDINENQNMQTPLKRYKQDRQQNEQMQKLNNQIILLEKMLKLKGLGKQAEYKKMPSKDIILSSTLLINNGHHKENISNESHFKKSIFKSKITKGNIYHDDLLYDKKRIFKVSQDKVR